MIENAIHKHLIWRDRTVACA